MRSPCLVLAKPTAYAVKVIPFYARQCHHDIYAILSVSIFLILFNSKLDWYYRIVIHKTRHKFISVFQFFICFVVWMEPMIALIEYAAELSAFSSTVAFCALLIATSTRQESSSGSSMHVSLPTPLQFHEALRPSHLSCLGYYAMPRTPLLRYHHICRLPFASHCHHFECPLKRHMQHGFRSSAPSAELLRDFLISLPTTT